MSKVKIATLQMKVFNRKETNIEQLADFLDSGSVEDADIIVLPEMFNCPYKTELFPEYAEEEGGPSWQALSNMARKHAKYIIAGTIPEKDGDKVYNTCYVFDREGRQIGKHRKVHLFEINARGKIVFSESETLTGGDEFGTFETEWGTMGLAVCFDIRFPEAVRIPALRGAKAVFVPAAFNMTSGPAHWEVSFRMRAIENQIFMIGAAPARDPEAGYTSWGHSIVTDPWGDVLSQLDEREGYEITEIDLGRIDEIREKLPIMSGRRTDLYDIVDKTV